MRRGANGRRAVVSAAIATGLLVGAPSCESFSSPSDVADAMTDAPLRDSTDDSASKDAAPNAADGAATDAGVNLFPAGDFEHQGCSGSSYFSTLIPDPIAHTGTGSCRVCNDGMSTDVFSLDAVLEGISPPNGARYVLEAWVRTASTVRPPASGVELTLRTRTDAPVTVHDNAFTGYTPVTDTWQQLTIALDVRESGIPILELAVDGRYDSGTCFLVDDVVVRREH